MKKSLLRFALVAFAALIVNNAQAQDRKLVNMAGYNWYSNVYEQQPDGSWGYTPVKLDEPTLYDNYYYYYNSLNQMSVEVNYSQYRYTYNEDGTKASREQWVNSGGVFYRSSVEAYDYDEEGNIILATTTSYNAAGDVTNTSPVEYSGYINGYYTVMKTPYYEAHYDYTFNDDNQPTQMLQMGGADFTTIQQGTFYTYENGLLVTEVQAYYDASAEEGHEWDNVTSTTNYNYNADGTINNRFVISDSRGQHSEVEWRYTYSTLDPSLIPQNVTADGTIGNNEVYVTWDAVAGAEKYIVMYDNSIAEVEGKTEYIIPTLTDGTHQVAVLAVVGGERKNLSDFVEVSVKDEGNLPMEDFQVLAAEKVDVESYGYVNQYYNLTLSWTVPEGASKITNYKVYVDKGDTWYPSATYTQGMAEADMKDSYNDVNTWITDRQNFYWTTFEDSEYDPDTWQNVSLGKGPDCKIWICAIYVTGESQPSNVVEVNVYNLANGIEEKTTGIAGSSQFTNNEPIEYFNLNGQQVSNTHGQQVVIMRQGNQVKKVIR